MIQIGAWLAYLCLWFLMVMTYSRGAVVAILTALGYWAWTSRKTGTKIVWLSSLMILLLLLWVTHGGQRILDVMMIPDGSTVNRWTVWKGGLQMLADCPQGVGRGNSGEIFMQWYQPLSMTTAYRTLVNSYLTLAVEYGFVVFWALVFLFVFIWRITTVQGEEGKSTGQSVFMLGITARASLLTFVVSGLFSTTFECKSLWLIPIISMLILIGIQGRRGYAPGIAMWREAGRHGLVAGILALLLASVMLFAGYAVNREDCLHRKFLGEKAILINSRQDSADQNVLFLIDRHVIGAHYGKLIRRVCEQQGLNTIAVWGSETTRNRSLNEKLCHVKEIVAAGRMVNDELFSTLTFNGRSLILISPESLERDGERASILQADRIAVFLPGLETDGRDLWWEKAFNPIPANVRFVELEGSGVDVSWRWDDIVKQIGFR